MYRLELDEGRGKRVFRAVWSQDSFLQSGSRRKVMEEVHRLLVRKEGWVVFTDIMGADYASRAELEKVLERLPVFDFGSLGVYRVELEERRFRSAKGGGLEDLTENFVQRYSKVLEMLDEKKGRQVREMDGEERVQRMKEGASAWVESGKRKILAWDIFVPRGDGR